MRVVIRNSVNKKFLGDNQRWVAKHDHALDFVSSVVALNVATRLELNKVEIVLHFGTGASEVVLNVPEIKKIQKSAGRVALTEKQKSGLR